MASIPGPVIFVIGLVVSGVSFFINKKSFAFNGPYVLFLYFGLILIFYGFVKIMIWYIMRKSKEENIEEQKKDITPGGVNQYQQGLNNQTQAQSVQSQINSGFQQRNIQQSQMEANNITQGNGTDNERYNYVMKCKNCGLTHFASYANFCQNCGTRLR